MSEKQRAALRERIHRAKTTASELSLAIGRAKDYVRDYLVDRKGDMSRSDWEKIDEYLDQRMRELDSSKARPADSRVQLDPEEVLIVLEELLRRSGMTDNAAREVAAEFLAALTDQQVLAPDRRSDVLRGVARHIARRVLP